MLGVRNWSSLWLVAFLSEEEVFSVATVARRWKALVFNHVNHALASVATFFHGLSEEEAKLSKVVSLPGAYARDANDSFLSLS